MHKKLAVNDIVVLRITLIIQPVCIQILDILMSGFRMATSSVEKGNHPNNGLVFRCHSIGAPVQP